MIIDSHCHLEKFLARNILDSTIENANNAGISQFVTIGTSTDDWPIYQKLCAQHPKQIAYTVGLHPCDVEDNWEEQTAQIEAFFKSSPKPVGIGEIGLDHFHLPKIPHEITALKKRQENAFRYQLALAAKLDCPIVVHSRNAFHDCVDIIDDSDVDWRRVVFHCFAEGIDEIEMLNERGGRGSFTGVITYKNAESVREAAIAQGMERIMIETDAPYLAPVPKRGKQNEPEYLRYTAKFCAELFSLRLEEFAEKASDNTKEFFGLN